MLEQTKKPSVKTPKKDQKDIPNNSKKQKSELKSEKNPAENITKKKEETKILSKQTQKEKKSLNISKIQQKDKTKSMKTTKKVAKDVYNIESLVKKQGSKYLVKWENFPSDQNTWEPKSSIPKFILKVLLS